MTAATVPNVDIAIQENVVTKMGINISLLMLCMVMNHESPHPNIIPNIISRSNWRESRLPEASFTSRSSRGPDMAKIIAKNADTRPHPPVAASSSASKLVND